MSTLTNTFLWSMPGGGEWLWIVLIVIILFGGKKIPELAKGLGKGIRNFNDAKDGIKKEIESGINDTPTTTEKNKTKVTE